MSFDAHLILKFVACGLALLSLSACAATPSGEVRRTAFGKANGEAVYLYSLSNPDGLRAKITNYGGILTEMHVPNRHGELHDVVLGFDTLGGYTSGHPFFGATVGRVANRIAEGKFTLEGKEYSLATNNGPNHLHGGEQGFDKRVWDSEKYYTNEGPAVRLHYTSPDGEEGYPGKLDVTVIYTLTSDNELRIEMTAKTDKPTLVNLSNHSYWNLDGHASGDVLGHEMQINADEYTPVDDDLIPVGSVQPVAGTAYDFTAPKPIGKDLNDTPGAENENRLKGYDINYAVNEPTEAGALRRVARVHEPTSGRVMQVLSNQPGVQFYTGNGLDGSITGKGGAVYHRFNGFCLETQQFPDAINQPQFPSIVLRPDETYYHIAVYKFETSPARPSE